MHEGIKGTADVTPDFNWSGPVARFSVRAIPTPVVQPGTYDVTVTNITTSKQGLSPLVIAAHPASAHGWQMGQPASEGLEVLAGDGMPDMLANEWRGIATSVATTKAHLLPGDSITVRINANPGDVLSAATMLIQTNDGFTGLHNMPMGGGSMDTMAYDAGTEDNTEARAHVPGPPFGGMRSGPDTNPPAAIAMHEGIAGRGDVTPDFNWSGPVARFSVQAVSSGTVMPGMPSTGAADTTIWLLAGLAATLALAGIVLRRELAPSARKR
jgi:LPXTG-motif cell wall-anchored protein